LAARSKVTPEQVKATLAKWRGDVAASARELGISRFALYQRIERHRIDLAGLRNHDIHACHPGVNLAPVNLGSGRLYTFAPRVQVSGAAIFPGREAAPILGNVTTPTPLPIETPPARRVAPPKLPPACAERVAAVRRRLAVAMNRDLDDAFVLEWLVVERLEEWAAEKLQALDAAPAADADAEDEGNQ
jgi:hypothetical protein